MSMKKADIKKFKEQLEELRQDLLKGVQQANEDVKSSKDAKAYSQHQADEGTDDFVRNLRLELGSKEMDKLRQVERALEKIEENTYGVCDISGKEIPLKRLEVIPYAVMTVEAQEKIEKGLL